MEQKAPTIFTCSHASLLLHFQMWEHVQSTSFLLLLEKCGNFCTESGKRYLSHHVNTRTQRTPEEFLSTYL